MEFPVHLPSTLSTTWVWWGSMVTVSVVNLFAFLFVLHHRKPSTDTHIKQYQKIMGRLAFPFVIECGWRSVFPSLYNERQVLIDSPLSSILLDRSLAAVGEVCWVMQMALALEMIASQLGRGRCMEWPSALMVLFAVTGEIFSYLGTFTTNCLFEVFETCCWLTLMAIGAACGLRCYCCLRQKPGASAAKRFTCIMALLGVTYCPYMVFSNIPMYYRRWTTDQAHHKQYLPIMQGISDAATHRVPTTEWTAWENDWFWMVMYFSFAVWSSILLMFAPRLEPVSDTAEGRELVRGIVQGP